MKALLNVVKEVVLVPLAVSSFVFALAFILLYTLCEEIDWWFVGISRMFDK